MTGQPQLSEAGKLSMSTQLLSDPQAKMTSTCLEEGELVIKLYSQNAYTCTHIMYMCPHT